tara:strand:+ start:1108 stop:1596 length:489 start_codon:yes stop_codon:yes gene_type:complete
MPDMPHIDPNPEMEVEAEALAQKVIQAYEQGSDVLFNLIRNGELTPEQQAIAHQRLMKTGGFPQSTYETPGFLDLIKSGDIKLQDSSRVNAAMALRMLMPPEAHAVRLSLGKTTHEPVDPNKFLGGSPAMQRHFREGKKISSLQLKQIITEELNNVLSEGSK